MTTATATTVAVTPTTDLRPLVGVPVQAHYRLTRPDRTCVATGVIHELRHGADTRPDCGLTNGVAGRMTVRTAAGDRSTWFWWPYTGLTITLTS